MAQDDDAVSSSSGSSSSTGHGTVFLSSSSTDDSAEVVQLDEPLAKRPLFRSSGDSAEVVTINDVSDHDDVVSCVDSDEDESERGVFVRIPTARNPSESMSVSWILENFQPSEGSSLKRCVMFNFYKEHCRNEGMEPINAASFGKLMRSIFVGLKTRRLGTRGNSKYHYYGLKVADRSPLKTRAELQCEEWPTPGFDKRSVSITARKRFLLTTVKLEPDQFPNFDASTMRLDPSTGALVAAANNNAAAAADHLLYTPGFSTSVIGEHTRMFVNCYKLHMKVATETILSKQLTRVERLINEFWAVYRSSNPISNTTNFSQPSPATPPSPAPTKHISGLSLDQLNTILSNDRVIDILSKVERRFNQSIVHCLIPDPLQLISDEYQETLLTFVDKTAEWTRCAIAGTPTRFQMMRAENAFHFGAVIDERMNISQLLRRAITELKPLASLHHVSEVFESINRNLIASSIGWTIEDDPNFVTNMDANIGSLLRSGQTLEQCVRSLLGYGFAYTDRFKAQTDQYQQACRTVIHNWNSYSAALLRCFFVRATESYTFFLALLQGMGNYLLQEMCFKYEMATPLVCFSYPSLEPTHLRLRLSKQILIVENQPITLQQQQQQQQIMAEAFDGRVVQSTNYHHHQQQQQYDATNGYRMENSSAAGQPAKRRWS